MRKADNLPPSCAVVTKSGSLNFLEPSGPLQACNGTALTLPFTPAFAGGWPGRVCYLTTLSTAKIKQRRWQWMDEYGGMAGRELQGENEVLVDKSAQCHFRSWPRFEHSATRMPAASVNVSATLFGFIFISGLFNETFQSNYLSIRQYKHRGIFNTNTQIIYLNIPTRLGHLIMSMFYCS